MTATLQPTPAAAPLRRLEDIPGPRGLPLLGNLFQLDPPHFHLQMEQWCREFGPYFRLRMGRRPPMLVVADHEVIAAVLRDRPDGFKRTSLLERIAAEMGLPQGVFGASGETWRRQRRMVMAGFDPAHVKGYFPSLQRVARRLDGRWQRAAQQGSAIDLQADLMRFTVDTIAGLAFGAEVNTLESDEDVIQRHLDKIFPALFRRMLSPFPTWRYLPSAADRALERSVAAVNEAVTGFIAQARARMQERPALREHPENLLEAMIVAAEREDSGIDDRQVAGNVLTMLLAGEDTTANTIAWMIHLLWRNPQALRDTVVGDVQVPAGTVVVSLMRRDSVDDAHVPNAAAFEPRRWLAEGGPAQQASAVKRISMPFGAGPRMCPGRYLALLEMKVAMAVLLGRFEIEAVDAPGGAEAEERLSFTMMPVGLKMRLRERAAG